MAKKVTKEVYSYSTSAYDATDLLYLGQAIRHHRGRRVVLEAHIYAEPAPSKLAASRKGGKRK